MCSRDKKNPHGGTGALIYSHDRLGIVQQVGSGTRLINSCVWRKQMGLLAASGCMRSPPPSRANSHPWGPLTPAAVVGALQGATPESPWGCGGWSAQVTSNKALCSQHHQADRYVRQTYTLTATVFSLCRVSRNVPWRTGDAGQASHCPLSQLILGQINTRPEPCTTQAIISHPDYPFPAAIFPRKEIK